MLALSHLFLVLAPYNSYGGNSGIPDRPKPEGSVEFALFAGLAFVLLAIVVTALAARSRNREAHDRE